MIVDENGEKQISPQALARSVIETMPTPAPGAAPIGTIESSLLYFVASVAEEISAWGLSPTLRDRQLRAFWPTESYFCSALGTVTARNAASSWNIDGPPRTSRQMQEVLDNANRGEGWQDLMSKTSMDLYTQDKGAFWEVVRATDGPEGVLIGLNNLDAERCEHTGNPEFPVVYRDRLERFHRLAWWQVVTLAEMPVPLEGKPGLQMCALSRMLRAVQVIRNITLYKEEKTGGRFTRAIHIVKGVTRAQMDDALAKATGRADAQGALRYVQPLIVPAVDPKADIDLKTLELAGMPDGYDEEQTFKMYITIIAMAFLSDYQDFSPLPGGNLGTSAQSTILHLKTKGKGPALFRKIITHALNFKVLPKAATFRFDELDIQADQDQAFVRKTRAETRAVQVNSGELTPEAARQLALDAGDIPQEVFDKLGGVDVTPSMSAQDESTPKEPSPKPVTPYAAAPVPEPVSPQSMGKKGYDIVVLDDPFWEKVLSEYYEV